MYRASLRLSRPFDVAPGLRALLRSREPVQLGRGLPPLPPFPGLSAPLHALLGSTVHYVPHAAAPPTTPAGVGSQGVPAPPAALPGRPASVSAALSAA